MDIKRRGSWAAAVVALVGCHRSAEAPRVAGTFNGGKITRADVDRESARMPAALRANFDSFAGRRELARSLLDKKLLAREALRRGFEKDPEVRRQVQELEERLAFLAARLDSSISGTQGSVSLNLLSKDLDQGLAIMREVLTAPRFQEDKIALRKQQMLQAMKERNDDSSSIEGREAGFLAFGEQF